MNFERLEAITWVFNRKGIPHTIETQQALSAAISRPRPPRRSSA